MVLSCSWGHHYLNLIVWPKPDGIKPLVPFPLDHILYLRQGSEGEDEEGGEADWPCVIKEQRQEAVCLHCQKCVELGRISPPVSWQIISFLFSMRTINVLQLAAGLSVRLFAVTALLFAPTEVRILQQKSVTVSGAILGLVCETGARAVSAHYPIAVLADTSNWSRNTLKKLFLTHAQQECT